MIPELGTFTLILAFCFALALATVPLLGVAWKNQTLIRCGKSLSSGMFFFLTLSFCVLVYVFVTDDFSVAYVANNSNSALPVFYKISATWGGHEGSLLLWVWILSGWTFAVSLLGGSMPEDVRARVLGVLGIVAVGFVLFVLATSSPFERYLPDYPADGGDLNPLLQDIGLILHPPLLYMGYVGFSVTFAFAIAALLSGRLDSAWARWSRPWTNIAWAFLTLGILLGSWWAYYELGWGGWWFWDPVENASFMPWLVGTALVHSLAVTEKRGVFKSWTLLLAIFTFSLSLLGTFLVRSGVLTSVHAFATDPTRGFFILMLLAITVGGSLTLYALKTPRIKAESQFSLVSRENFLLINNILLSIVALTVLLGTIYPLIMDALGLGKLSVGPPYFNSFFIPMMSLLVLALGVGIVTRWKQSDVPQLGRTLLISALASVGFAVISVFLYSGEFSFQATLGIGLSLWVLLITLRDLSNKIRSRQNKWAGLRNLSRSYYGMILAHMGVAVTVVGITMVSLYNQERDLRMNPGDSMSLGDYSFTFKGISPVRGANYSADQGVFEVSKDGSLFTLMAPEKRNYNVRGQVMTEAAIDAGLFRDLYIALGEPLEGGAWAVRVQHKPFVRWIWLGGLLMALGGIWAVLDKRYRRTGIKI